MAYPVVQSVATSSGNASPRVVAAPSGLQVGDLLILWASASDTGSGGSGPNAPDGTWTLINTDAYGANGAFTAWWKIATSSELGGVSFTWSNNSNAGESIGALIRITNFNPAATITASNQGTGTTTTTPTSSGVAPPVQSLLLILVAAIKNGTGGASSASAYQIANSNPTWTELFDVAYSNGGAGFDHGELAAAWANETGSPGTSTGNAQATLSASSTQCVVQLIAIAPPPTVTPTVLSLASHANQPSFVRLIITTALSLTSHLGAAIVSEVKSKWSNPAKNVASWLNPPKS